MSPSQPQTSKPYVLCVGYRQGLARVLYKKQIPYSVLTDKELKFIPKGADTVVFQNYKDALDRLDDLKHKLPKAPTHIIAGAESAVFPASLIRAYFNARASEHSMIRLCTHKAEMKTYLNDRIVKMTKFIVDEGHFSTKEIINKLGLPVVVKEAESSGGRGVKICQSIDEFLIHKKWGRVYESFIDAPEGSIESFINNNEILFTNVTEYYKKTQANLLPAPFSADELQQIIDLNEDVISKLSIQWGMTHLEFYRHHDGLLFGEIALRPPGGHIMAILKTAYGFNAWEALLAVELNQDFSFPEKASKYAASVIHHPGAGVIKNIHDLDLDSIPSMIKHKIQAKVGDKVSARESVGRQLGYSILANKNVEELKWDLDTVLSEKIFSL